MTSHGIPDQVVYKESFTAIAQKILSLAQTNSDQQPQLNKHDVSRSAEFEKQLPLPTEAEILEGAKRLWKVPRKLDAVKQVMRLGYSLKDAKTYCEQHFG